jgi:hypothetical protein
MSSPLFDLILLWSPDPSDTDYQKVQDLLQTEFATQLQLHEFTKTQEAIKHLESRDNASRPSIIITKLGVTEESLGQPLIETIRQRDKRTFIILHSHKVCADPALR